MPLLALGHQMALSLLTLMLGSALTPKPRASKRDATAMIRPLGFGLDRNAEPQPVNSEAVKLIKRGPEYGHHTRHFSGVSDATDEALVVVRVALVLTLLACAWCRLSASAAVFVAVTRPASISAGAGKAM